MSRGDRAAATGILSTSMRDNYGECGYYKKVGSTYRNPHYPGIQLCIFAWLCKWWSNESSEVTAQGASDVLLFDMACGSGEVTVAFHEWLIACKHYSSTSSTQPSQGDINKPEARTTLANITSTSLARKLQTYCAAPLGSDFPMPLVVAADPFTSAAYKDRTSLPCATLSFNDIAEGNLPPFASDISKIKTQARSPMKTEKEEFAASSARQEPYATIEMVVCSFALHLIEDPSALFALLCVLSYKTRWLVVLAPHKKPEIKGGWGWEKWNVEEWRVASMSSRAGELLYERVHCRVYRSVNY
ncbi:hypothetical protein AN958_07602 [Leucoagaricus sp. SymC.cos]|nr:hypothetical protein AN958_07602 [Leucoagaricus sp. SymC.cos]